jgi:hypothetical protein
MDFSYAASSMADLSPDGLAQRLGVRQSRINTYYPTIYKRIENSFFEGENIELL